MPPGPAPKSSDHKSIRRNFGSAGCVIISPEDTDVNAPQVSRSLSIPYPPLDAEPHAAECENTEDFKPRRIQSRPTDQEYKPPLIYIIYPHCIHSARQNRSQTCIFTVSRPCIFTGSPFHRPDASSLKGCHVGVICVVQMLCKSDCRTKTKTLNNVINTSLSVSF